MIPSIPLPYKIAALAVALVIAYFTGRSHGLERYYDFKASVEQAQEQIRQDNERKLSAVQAESDEVRANYAAARRELDRLGRIVRVQPHRCPGEVPAVPATAGRPDETPAAGTISAEQCEAYLNDGIRDTAQLLWLQRWITKTHEASK